MPLRRALSALVLAAALGAAAGCDDCGAPGPPPLHAPDAVRIPVELDGVEVAVIDAARLGATTPDFVDGDRRSWKLASLVGVAYHPGLVVEIEEADGKRTILALEGEDAAGLMEPTLAINRTGEIRIGIVRPDEPFPPFHGRGGNRGRSGEPGRVREATRIFLASHAPARDDRQKP